MCVNMCICVYVLECSTVELLPSPHHPMHAAYFASLTRRAISCPTMTVTITITMSNNRLREERPRLCRGHAEAVLRDERAILLLQPGGGVQPRGRGRGGQQGAVREVQQPVQYLEREASSSKQQEEVDDKIYFHLLFASY